MFKMVERFNDWFDSDAADPYRFLIVFSILASSVIMPPWSFIPSGIFVALRAPTIFRGRSS